jgi:glutamine phosphoribosylpyrophosphate amidotransferase
MCGIVGFLDKTAGHGESTGQVILSMLEALACRGPDGTGVALIGNEPRSDAADCWRIRVAPSSERAAERLVKLGRVVEADHPHPKDVSGQTTAFLFEPRPGVTAAHIEQVLRSHGPAIEVLSLGRQLDLVKQVGSPAYFEATFGVSRWAGPLGIGHTRMSTESRIDLSHSQPFWVHGVPDVATVHNGHITNYHQLRRRYEQQGVVFYTDNDSEVIGVYLRDRLEAGRTLPEALSDSIDDLDGAFNYLVAAPEGLGVVRDRHGFKPLVIAETDTFVAIATEEIAIRRAIPGRYRVSEPGTGCALFYPSHESALAGA